MALGKYKRTDKGKYDEDKELESYKCEHFDCSVFSGVKHDGKRKAANSLDSD